MSNSDLVQALYFSPYGKLRQCRNEKIEREGGVVMVTHYLNAMLLSPFDSYFQIAIGGYMVFYPSLKFSI